MSKWTMKDVVIGKTRPVLILTFVLTILMSRLIEQVMTKEVAVEGGLYNSYTTHFSLGVYGVLLAIPAGFLSIYMMKFLMNTLNKKQSHVPRGQKEFKWYRIYGTIVGYVIFFSLLHLGSSYIAQKEFANEWGFFLWNVIVLVLPIAIAVFLAKLLNNIMVKITKTNISFIEDIETGLYNGKFASQIEKLKILNLLSKGVVSSIHGGKFRLKVNNFLRRILRVVVFLVQKIPVIQRPTSNASDAKRATERARLENELRKKKGNYNHATKEAINQANYKRNTIFMQNRLDDFDRADEELEEAEKEWKDFNRF